MVECRMCEKTFEEGEGIFVEFSGEYFHCEDCHEKLYTPEEWDMLVNAGLEYIFEECYYTNYNKSEFSKK